MNGKADISSLIQPLSDYYEKYTTVKELGRGKFGIVYRVKEKLSSDHDESVERKSFASKHIR